MKVIEKLGHIVYPISAPAPYGLHTYNFYLLKHKNSLSLIDAGFHDEACWNALNKTLEENGFVLNDITEILLTHHHIDHIGLIERITQQHDIPVYAHPNAIIRLRRDPTFMKMRVDFFEKLYQEMNCGEDGQKQIKYLKRALENNKDQALEMEFKTTEAENTLFDFTVKEVFGHAPDQIAFFDKKRQWFFAGDYLIGHMASNAIVEPDEKGNRILSLVQSVQTHQACLAYDFDTVFSGHGEIISRPKDLIRSRLNRIEEKSERIKQLISSGINTGSDLAKHLYQSTYKQQFALVMSEIIGQLDLLESGNQIEKSIKNGISIFENIN